MKKLYFIVFQLIIFQISISQNFYFRVGGGYGLGTDKELSGLKSFRYYETSDTSYSSYSYKSVGITCGQGLNAFLTFGSRINKNINFELQVNYAKGKSPDNTYTEKYDYDLGYIAYVNIDYSFGYKTKSLQFEPRLIIQSNPSRLNPWVGFGLVYGMVWMQEDDMITIFNTIPGYYPSETIKQIVKYEKTSSPGYSINSGINLEMIRNIYFFLEGKYSHLTFEPNKAEVIEYTHRTIDKINELNINERYIEFVDSYEDSENTRDSPSKSLINRFSVSHISLLAGFKIFIDHFNKNEK